MVSLVPQKIADSSMWYLACIPLELFKGLNSGLVTAGAVRIASDLAPPGGANTAQGLFTGILVGFSTFVGGILSIFLFSCDESLIEGRTRHGVQYLWYPLASLYLTLYPQIRNRR